MLNSISPAFKGTHRLYVVTKELGDSGFEEKVIKPLDALQENIENEPNNKGQAGIYEIRHTKYQKRGKKDGYLVTVNCTNGELQKGTDYDAVIMGKIAELKRNGINIESYSFKNRLPKHVSVD
jgi:hypothetical protein